MKAHIFEYDAKTRSGRCVHEDKVYSFKLSENLELHTADEAEIKVIRKPQVLKDGKCLLLGPAISLDIQYPGTAVTKESAYPEHRTINKENDLLLCAEGPNPKECLDNMVSYLDGTNANCLLDLKISGRTGPLRRGVLWTASAHIAMVEGERFHCPARSDINIRRNEARPNSPNKNSQRYTRVLLICALMILIPIIISVGKRMTGSYIIALLLCPAALTAALYWGLSCFPKKSCVYLFKSKSLFGNKN